MLAAKTPLPVLGVPVTSAHLQGLDSLLSIVQMPAGMPVATFAIGAAGAHNAGLYAVAILALTRRRAGRGGSTPSARPRPSACSSSRSRGPRDPARRHRRRARRRPARPDVHAAGALDGLPRGGARSRSAEPGRAAWPTATSAADYADEAALDALAAACAAVTTEFENVPAAALERLARHEHRAARRRGRGDRPGPDRREAAFCSDSGFATAPFRPVALGARSSQAAVARSRSPALLKTSRLGYDGKGQAPVTDRPSAPRGVRALRRRALRAGGAADARDRALGRAGAGRRRRASPPFRWARTGTGTASSRPRSCRPACPSGSPTRRGPSRSPVAERMAYVGVLGVELFVANGGRLFVNEMAPRPHNSGHYTMDACSVDQFEQQLRALCGLPLGEPRLLTPVAMINLLGDLWRAGRAALGRGAPPPRRPPAPLRQGRAEAGPEDGPPQLPRPRRRRRRSRSPSRRTRRSWRPRLSPSDQEHSMSLLIALALSALAGARRRMPVAGRRHRLPGPASRTMSPSRGGRARSIRSPSRVAKQPVKLCYGRPSLARAQMIGGEAVPYGKLWRTGANEPTIFFTPVARDSRRDRRCRRGRTRSIRCPARRSGRSS